MRQKIFNIMIDNISMEECIEKIDKLIKDGKKHYVVTPNVDHIVKLQNDSEFLEVYEHADLIVVDGMPIVWYSKFIKQSIIEKISGSDLFPKICENAAIKNQKIFLLGAAKGVGERAKKNLESKYKGLEIVGTYSPKFGFEKDDNEINNIINFINSKKPDILAVGLGAPKQEKFIYKYKELLDVPLSLAIGASIDFEAGNIKRAPIWMRKIGLEWFYRLLKEPKRLYRRYLIEDRKFLKIAFEDYKSRKKNLKGE